MENFKQIAEDCLAGKLSGTFINRRGDIISSDKLHKFDSIKYPYIYGEDCITRNGNFFYNEEKISGYDIIDFIPDMKKEQITIDVPEGMEAVQETVDGEIRIRFVEKKLTYDLLQRVVEKENWIYKPNYLSSVNNISNNFFKKVEVLRKLTNIRNYFGGNKPTNSWLITIDSARRPYVINNPRSYRETCFIYFDTQEHAQAAIDMLGDELKYLFEPW